MDSPARGSRSPGAGATRETWSDTHGRGDLTAPGREYMQKLIVVAERLQQHLRSQW